MLTITGLITLIIIAVFIWFWQSSMRAKELAIAASKKACLKRNLQFLDETTDFKKIRLKRNESGKVCFLRCYNFDYYDGENRSTSVITIFDNKVIDIDLPPLPANNEIHYSNGNVIQFPKDKNHK